MQRIAVIGLGRFGLALAERLAREGLEVIAIDSNPDLINRVKDSVALAVAADGTDMDTLRSLGVDKVDTVVIAIGDNFEACQLAMLAAKDLDHPIVVARANDRTKEKILKRLGAHEVILPEEQAAERLGQKLAKPGLLEALDIGNEHSFVQVEAPPGVCGRTLLELDLRRHFGVNMVAIRKPGRDGKDGAISVPGPDTKLEKDDVMMLVGKDSEIERFMRANE